MRPAIPAFLITLEGNVMLMQSAKTLGELENACEFIARHIGVDAADEAVMLKAVGAGSRRALIETIVPHSIARKQPMDIPAPVTEATAAAEAMTLALRAGKSKSSTFFIDSEVLPQTLAVIQTRARPLGITVKVGGSAEALSTESFAVLLQYPGSSGVVRDERDWIAQYKAKGGVVIMAADLLALTLLTPPGELGADIAVGTTQRFGMPMGNGGPHAAYLACRDDFKRAMPGRLVGVSVDVHGKPAYRLALQTREQHIRREKATSNICTAQVLPAVVASMYAVYHGPQGLKRIAQRVAAFTAVLARGLQDLGFRISNATAFDTLTIHTAGATDLIAARAHAGRANLRLVSKNSLGVSLDETTTRADIEQLWGFFSLSRSQSVEAAASLSASAGRTLVFAQFEQGIETLLP